MSNPHESLISQRRMELFKEIIGKRQMDLTVVLENVHDPHNIAAVLRTCDSVGIPIIYAIVNDPRIPDDRYSDLSNKSASGAVKWVEVREFRDVHEAMLEVKSKYHNILATHLSDDASDLYGIDFKGACAIVFGNEHAGISPELMEYVDTNFVIPQEGFVKSLNISVACAVTLYEVMRQRRSSGNYAGVYNSENENQVELLDSYILKHRKIKSK